MPSSLRAFVQIAHGLHGLEWVDVPLPRLLGVGEDNGHECELKLPDDPVFREVLLDRRCRSPGDLRYLPAAWSKIDLYDPPHCSNGSWDKLHDILNYPWERLVPSTAAPLFNERDQGVTALVSCAPTLAILARILGTVNQTPRNVRLIYWLENA